MSRRFTLTPLACALALHLLPVGAAADTPLPASQQQQIDYDIPAGSLEDVLLAISQRSGNAIAYDQEQED